MKEMPVPPSDTDPILALSSQIIAAYVTRNAVDHDSLPGLIRDVRAALAGATEPSTPVEQPLVPAVNPKKSVFGDHIVCLEDGQRMKVLRRHLKAAHGMTPGEYRQRWGLPADYPMTAPAYAAVRSELAKDFGLGRKPGAAGAPPVGGSAVSAASPAQAKAAEAGADAATAAVADELTAQPASDSGQGKRKSRPRTRRAAPLRRRSPKARR